jgi:hypothetical protein
MPAVTAMSSMFAQAGATKFNADLSHWDVSNVRDRNCIFDGAIIYRGVGWDNFHRDSFALTSIHPFLIGFIKFLIFVFRLCRKQFVKIQFSSVGSRKVSGIVRKNGCFDDGPD